MFCNKCGKPMGTDDAFCQYCGAKSCGNEETDLLDNAQERLVIRRGNKRIGIRILAIATAILVVTTIVVVTVTLLLPANREKQALKQINDSKAFSYNQIERILGLNGFCPTDINRIDDMNQHLLRSGIYSYQGDLLYFVISAPNYTLEGSFIPNKCSLGSEYDKRMQQAQKEIDEHNSDIYQIMGEIDKEAGRTHDSTPTPTPKPIQTSEEQFESFVESLEFYYFPHVGYVSDPFHSDSQSGHSESENKNYETEVSIYGEGDIMCGFITCENGGRVACYKKNNDVFYVSVCPYSLNVEIDDEAIEIFDDLLEDFCLPKPF